MKSLSLLASITGLLFLPGGVSLILPMPVMAQKIVPLTDSNDSVDQVARSITVRVFAKDNRASGTLIAREGRVYTVLTNAHVLTAGVPYRIETVDGKIHDAEEVLVSSVVGLDAALLQFRSSDNYRVGQLAKEAASMAVGQPVWAAGFPEEQAGLLVTEGSLSLLPNQSLAEGYQLGYSNEVVSGMSGGPLLNQQGEVLGIHGLSAYPILNDSYVFMDGSQPNAALREEMRRLSWAVPVQVALGNAPEEIPPNPPFEIPPNPPFERGGNGNDGNGRDSTPVPAPEENPPVAQAPKQQLTGVAARVDAVAERITVRIESDRGNGSGVVVAKQGNTYYVVTAAHVVGAENSYQVVAPDGARYPVTEVKTQEAMDLAVVQFTSPQSYPVANLADYRVPQDEYRWVFVSGWPVNRGNRRLLTGGLVFSKDWGALLGRYNESLAQSEANPENQGYELVYTNITHKGMSGGAVLDAEGRVIGFHAAADGDALEEVLLGYSFGVPVSTFLGLAKRLGMQRDWLQVETTAAALLSEQEDAEVRENLFATAVPSANGTERDWVNYGNQLWRIFEYEAAVQAFDRAVQRKPDFYQAWYARGLALKDLAKYPEAIASFDKAIEYQPNFYPAWREKATVLENLTKWSEALVAINRAIAINAEDAVLYWQKGWYLQNLKRYEEAIAAYTQAIEIKPHPFAYINRGIVYDELRDLEKAIADSNEAIRLNPGSALAYNNRGRPYYKQGDYQKAISDYNEAIRLNPEFAQAYNNRGLAYYNQGDLEKAIADYNQAIRLNPEFAGAYYSRGLAYYNQGDLERAISDYSQAIQINQNWDSVTPAEAYFGRGLAYFDLGNLDRAISDYNEAIRLNPEYANAYTNRGNVYYYQGNLDRAISDYNEAIRLNPEDATAYRNRGVAYANQGNFERAIADFNQAIRLNPQYVDAYFNRGVAYSDQGNLDGAIADYNEAIRLNPESVDAYNNRGNVYYNQGNLDRAIADYNEAIRLNPEYANAYYGRGNAYRQQGNNRQALENFRKAAELYQQQGNQEWYQNALEIIRQLE